MVGPCSPGGQIPKSWPVMRSRTGACWPPDLRPEPGITDAALDVAARLDVGMVGINGTVKRAPDLPFGGVKRSGIGRELGRFGPDEFANKKLIRQV